MVAFMPKFEQLPVTLPIFPLDGVLLLPGGELPLRVFEPRYIEMFDEALKGSRLIGMVQPIPNQNGTEQNNEVFTLGTAGRITSFTETNEGTYDLNLTGIIRFEISKEFETQSAYRVVKPRFKNYKADLIIPNNNDIQTTVSASYAATIEKYFRIQKIEADMEAIEQAPREQLINTLAMSCPFSTLEKQALLQAIDLQEREAILLSLMQMATTETVEPSSLN